jgi:ferrous iron transport protein B
MVLELPPYRLPDVRAALLTTWDRAVVFLKNAGTVILAICVVLWWMSAYPKSAPPEAAVALEARAVEIESSGLADATLQTVQVDEAQLEEIRSLRSEAEVLTQRAQQEFSFAGRLGGALQPAFAPLGLDDRLTIAVLTSFLAREVFRSTMTVLVGHGDSEDDTRVAEDLAQATRRDGTKLFDIPTSTGLLVFYVLALQCLPTLAVTRRETGSWKWPAIQFLWMSSVAYLFAYIAREAVILAGLG